jgi:L-lactate dehydrogenase
MRARLMAAFFSGGTALKISIVGLGHVGSTLAYALVLQGLATELVLVDKSADRARGDALDLAHSMSFCSSSGLVRAGGLEDTAGSDILVLALSVPRLPSMKERSDLAAGNRALYRECLPALARLSPEARLVVITNPVDAMTWWAIEDSGFPSSRVMGIGTLVDSARFRMELSRIYAIHAEDIRAYVLGEHGPTQFAALSAASSGGEPIGDRALAEELLARQAASAGEIIAAKGYTNFAIASGTAMVLESVVRDRHRTIPVSVRLEDYLGVSGVCLTVPCVLGAGGVERILKPRLDAEELAAFRRSAEAVAALIASVPGVGFPG